MPILGLIRRAWIIAFLLMGSDGADSLGTEVINASPLVNNYGARTDKQSSPNVKQNWNKI